MKFSGKIEKCELSPVRKFAPYERAAAERGVKIYHLNIGQPDIPTPKQYFDAVRSFSEPVLEYAPSDGMPVLTDAIRAYYARLGAEIDADQILVTNGGSEALQIAVSCVLDDGDEIIIPEPFYPNYSTFVTLAGGVIRPVTTRPEDGYRYAFRDRIEAAINGRTRAMLFTNPGNPTGTVLSADEIKLLTDIARERELFIIADEVYREYVYGGEKLMTMLQVGGCEENVIVVDSVSKRFSACGARVGCLISRNGEFIANAMKWCQGRLCAATVAQTAAAALYGVEQSYYDGVCAEYRRRRDALAEGLRQIPGVVFSEPEGAFYIMASLPVDDAERLQLWMLESFELDGETMMFTPGEGFYKTPGMGRNEIRMAYVINETDIRRSMEILKKGIEAYNNR